MKTIEEFYEDSPTKTKTRMRIIEVAAKFFSDIGIDTVNMTDIAQECDVTIRNLYRYYGGKEYLVVDVAYYLFCKTTNIQVKGGKTFELGIHQLKHLLCLINKVERSDSAGLSMTKFIMYFDLYLTNMATNHPAYIKYTEEYVPHIQELGVKDVEVILRKGMLDGSIHVHEASISSDAEYIIQSLFSIIMRTLVKESENKTINESLVEKHIDVLVAYYGKKENIHERS